MRCIHCLFSGTSIEIRDHQRGCSPWKAVVEARAAGTPVKANRIRKQILGIEVKPMPPEVIERRKASGVGLSKVRQRAKAEEKAALRAQMKPANIRRGR
jgi:hypothetical protein